MQKKVMKINDYEDGSSFWRVACDCSDPNHDVNLWFEGDEDSIPQISLNMDMEISSGAGLWSLNVFQKLWWRIKTASKILFTGYHEMRGDVILDVDGIKALQTAINNGLDHALECSKKFKQVGPSSYQGIPEEEQK